jgi:hypothetical protein
MNNESPFSLEYDIGETTDTESSKDTRDKTIISDGTRKSVDILEKLSTTFIDKLTNNK